MKYKAFVKAEFEVEFEEDGGFDLTDLASEAVEDALRGVDVCDYEIKEVNKQEKDNE